MVRWGSLRREKERTGIWFCHICCSHTERCHRSQWDPLQAVFHKHKLPLTQQWNLGTVPNPEQKILVRVFCLWLLLISGHGFKDLMSCLKPGYTIPSRKHITKQLHHKHLCSKFEETDSINNRHLDKHCYRGIHHSHRTLLRSVVETAGLRSSLNNILWAFFMKSARIWSTLCSKHCCLLQQCHRNRLYDPLKICLDAHIFLL